MDHTKELIELSHSGNKEARDVLVLDNLGLVYSIARKYLNRGYDFEDICQIGTIGLIKAIDKFDLEQPVMFSTYAVPMIIGEIKRFLRDDGIIKISRSVKENSWKILKAMDTLTKDLGRDATMEELSSYTGIAMEDIVVAMESSKEVESIYQTVYQGEGSDLYMVDKLAASSECNPNEQLINHMMLEQEIADLSETERALIRLRYYEEKTQTEVAKLLGISQVQVSRLEKKILQILRGKIYNG